jgi:uncharacterized membrane protein
MSSLTGGHVHAHAHAPAPASGAGRWVLAGLVLAIIVATVVGMYLLRPDGAQPSASVNDTERIKATVTALQQVSCSESIPGADFSSELDQAGYAAPEPECTDVTVRIDEGPDVGEVFQTLTGPDVYRRVGQGVVLLRATDPAVPPEARYQLADVQRAVPLLALSGIFVVAILALGRLRGALAVVGAGVSLVVLVEFLVPALVAGRPPLLTAVVGASAVMVVVLLLAHGPNVRTATAMVGTAGALLLTMTLATAFVELAGLSGLTSEEAGYVQATFGEVDLRGLLLAGIVIGALGILDDVTVTQVSTVHEIRAADPAMPRRRLYSSALRVGRDHIASTVNTLLLAYAGASMPLLVIFTTSGAGLTDTLTNGVLAEEIVRTLVGSVGLIAAVPLTTALAAAMSPVRPSTGDGGEPTDEGDVPAGPRRPVFDEESWAKRAALGSAQEHD